MQHFARYGNRYVVAEHSDYTPTHPDMLLPLDHHLLDGQIGNLMGSVFPDLDAGWYGRYTDEATDFYSKPYPDFAMVSFGYPHINLDEPA